MNIFSIYLKYVVLLGSKQESGLPMGNPLSGVLACLFIGFLESCPFQLGLPINATYLTYIYYIPIFLPKNKKLKEIAAKLNYVEHSISSTYENEWNNTILIIYI